MPPSQRQHQQISQRTSHSRRTTTTADRFISKVWDTHTGECLHTIQHNHIVRSVAFPCQPRPQIIATGGHEKKLIIYELSRSSPSNSNNSSPDRPTFSLQNKSASQPATGFEIGTGSHTAPIKSVIWGSDPNILMTVCDDKQIRWFDIRTRTAIASHELSGKIGSCELNAAMTTLSVAAGKTASFFSGAVPGQLLKSITLPSEIDSLAIHEGERKFVTGGAGDTWIKVWDLDSESTTGGLKELDVWKGHHGPIWSLGFSPDGKLCASGSEDGTVKLWKFCEGAYGLWK